MITYYGTISKGRQERKYIMSLTITALAVLVLNYYVTQNGIELASEEIQSFVQQAAFLLAPIGVWYGRFRQGDITIYGKKITD